MMQDILNRFLMIMIAVDLLAVGLFVLFLINFRVNVRRRIAERELALLLLTSIQKSDTTAQVAKIMNMDLDAVTRYCLERGIELPEARNARIETQKQKKEAENRRIQEEENAWRAEQERIAEDRQRERELEAKRRKERLHKFGIT